MLRLLIQSMQHGVGHCQEQHSFDLSLFFVPPRYALTSLYSSTMMNELGGLGLPPIGEVR